MKLETPESTSAFSKALNMLKRLRRLDGVVLINSGVLMHSDLPPNPNSGSEHEFAREVVTLFEGYESEGKDVDQVLLGFDGGYVLLFYRFPVILGLLFNDLSTVSSVEKGGLQFLTQFEAGLGIRKTEPIRTKKFKGESAPVEQSPDREANLPDANDTADQEGPAESEIARADTAPAASPVPADPAADWSEFSRKIELLFSKVLGSAQARRIIKRELSAMGLGDGELLLKSQYRAFGLKLTGKVRDKAVRRQLETELVDFIRADEE